MKQSSRNTMHPYGNAITMLIVFFLIGISQNAFAQLSSGGIPIEIDQLKSVAVHTKKISMPEFDRRVEQEMDREASLTKTITYAHSFDVDLTPQNSGVWHHVGAYKVWQLEIESKDAKGIGLIFTRFHLPDGARLFLFDENKTRLFGAYTHLNNKPFKKLAIFPFPGELVIVQAEIPVAAINDYELTLGKVNHDFLGVNDLKSNRWKQRSSGACNVDVNCDISIASDAIQRSVIRILSVDELGTATLLNNTAEDGKPYVISAFHIYDKNENAEVTLYDFNYESPFCVDLDGYDNQTISGASAVASDDSLDFMLVELSDIPPPVFRPYYAGWNATNSLPSASFTLHHPNGDVKKISIDEGVCDSMTFTGGAFYKMAHWKVLNWEKGTTERGSSGAGLFDNQHQLRGTLSGGAASCDNLAYDAFSRFDKMWNYYSAADRSLSTWLDPLGEGSRVLDGLDIYRDVAINCTLFSNFLIDDAAVVVDPEIEMVAEMYTSIETGVLSGVAVGIDHYVSRSGSSRLKVGIYNSADLTEKPDNEFHYPLEQITEGAMNYFNFIEPVEVEDTFYISIGVVDPSDSLLVYRSAYRNLNNSNTLYLKSNGEWRNASSSDKQGRGASCLLQVNACGASFQQDLDSLDENKLMKYYPNPVSDFLTVEFANYSQGNDLQIYDMTGRLLFSECYELKSYASVDLSTFQPGIYIVRVEVDGKVNSGTISVF